MSFDLTQCDLYIMNQIVYGGKVKLSSELFFPYTFPSCFWSTYVPNLFDYFYLMEDQSFLPKQPQIVHRFNKNLAI